VRALWCDLRFAARVLRKSPGFTAVVVIALALGLGVNTAVFGAIESIIFRPLPVERPDQLAALFLSPVESPDERRDWPYPDYALVRNETALFTGVGAFSIDQITIGTGGALGEASELINVERVSDNYFDVLGLRPLLGRSFSTDESGPKRSTPAVVISHGLWTQRFHRDPGIIGRQVTLVRTSYTIVGVMPASYRGARPRVGFSIDVWIPLAVHAPDGWFIERGRTDNRVMPLGRLRPGVSHAAAQARLQVLAENLATQFPVSNAGLTATVTSEIAGRAGSGAFFRALERASYLALFIAGLVLLISCANVANLLLARAAVRTKEIGIRLALGAGRARLIRQLLTESMLLALLGGAAGFLVALWFGDLLRLFLPPMPGFIVSDLDLQPDTRVLLWALGSCVLAGVGFGAIPAWRATRIDLVTALKSDVASEGHSARKIGLRQLLVVLQLAISIVVVVAGGLLLRSLTKLQNVDPGYRTDTLVSAQVNPSFFETDPAQLRRWFGQLVRRLEAQPGIRSVSSSTFMPLVHMSGPIGPVVRQGDPPPATNQGLELRYSVIFPRYFETMETELLFGRDFQPSEREGTPASAVVNATLARRLYGNEREALGKRFRAGSPQSPLLEIVGIAKDGRYFSLTDDAEPFVFLPGYLPDTPDDVAFRSVLMRAQSARDLPGIVEAFRTEMAALDARVPIETLLVGSEHLNARLFAARIAAEIGAILGFLALALATLGIYSVMTYTVSRRTKELGIRMALGGQVHHVLELVLGQGMRLIGAGVLMGALGGFAISRLLDRFLYGVGGSDPVTFAATIAILVAVALLATFLPARRATKVDPMVALRYE
jgi:predicted permease